VKVGGVCFLSRLDVSLFLVREVFLEDGGLVKGHVVFLSRFGFSSIRSLEGKLLMCGKIW